MKRKMSQCTIPDKNQTRIEDILFWTQKRNFRFVTFILTNSRENKLSLQEILQKFCKIVTHFGNSKVKNEDPWKFHMNFSWIPLEIPLPFLFTTRISAFFLQYPWKFHLDFSGIAHFCSCMPTFFKLWFGVYHVYTMCTRFVKIWYLSASVMLQR